MIGAKTGRLLSVSLVLLAMAGLAEAGILAVDDDAIAEYQGTKEFDGSLMTFRVHANVDYAVYAPGTFDGAMAEAFPSLYHYGGGGIRNELDLIDDLYYVYAYQIFPLSLPPPASNNVTQMTVGLDADETLGHIGFLVGTGDVSPTSDFFYGTPPTSARWDFSGIAPDMSSQILFFASSGQPEWDSGIVKGVASASLPLPSPDDQPPLPEPGTLAMLAVGCLALIRRGRRAV